MSLPGHRGAGSAAAVRDRRQRSAPVPGAVGAGVHQPGTHRPQAVQVHRGTGTGDAA